MDAVSYALPASNTLSLEVIDTVTLSLALFTAKYIVLYQLFHHPHHQHITVIIRAVERLIFLTALIARLIILIVR